jgi:hypothetical protein
MALISCPECNKQISDKANICVGCGAPVVIDLPQPNFKSDANIAEEISAEDNTSLNTSNLTPTIDNSNLDNNEITFMEGAGSYVKSTFNVIQGTILLTSKRFVFFKRSRFFNIMMGIWQFLFKGTHMVFEIELSKLKSIHSEKHGLGSILIFTTTQGEKFPIQFGNFNRKKWLQCIIDAVKNYNPNIKTSQIGDNINFSIDTSIQSRIILKSSDDALSELKKEKDKFDLGLITQSEFETKKVELKKIILKLPKSDLESDATLTEEGPTEKNISLNTSNLKPEIDNSTLDGTNSEIKRGTFKTFFGYILVSLVVIFLIFLLTGGLNTSPISDSTETTIPVTVDSRVFGTYIFKRAGIKGVITLKSENNNIYDCEIQMYLNNEVVAGFPIEGTYVFKPSNKLEFNWEVPELNTTMSSMTVIYLPKKQILRLLDGTDYIKKY